MDNQKLQNLNAIEAVIEALLTYFSMSAANDTEDAISQIQVNATTNLLTLKNELLQEYHIPQAVSDFQQNPFNLQARGALKQHLTEALGRHRAFNENATANVTVKGNISADRGGIAGGVLKGNYTLDNTFEEAQEMRDGDVETQRSSTKSAPTAESKPLPVEFLALAAQHNPPGSPCIVDIWACLAGQAEEVREKAALTDLTKVIGMKAGLSIESGAALAVSLEVRGMQVMDAVTAIHWQGDPVNASFIVEVPADALATRYPAKATISSAGITIATIVFLFTVSTAQQETDKVTALGETRYPRSAFASYASANRQDVMERIQGMQAVAPKLDIFFDVKSLRAGQYWLPELERNVRNREVLYLFWSEAAAASEWVEKEWRLALGEKGVDAIHPVPLDEPDRVPPPTELSALHFNDAWLMYIKYQEMRKDSDSSAPSPS